jgi:hypothetical protein
MEEKMGRKVEKPDVIHIEITGTNFARQFFVDGFWEFLNEFQVRCAEELEGKRFGMNMTSSRPPSDEVL